MPDELSATEVGKEIGEHANHASGGPLPRRCCRERG